MTAVQNSFLPALTEQEGLLQFQKIVVNNAVISAGSTCNTFFPSSDPGESVPFRDPSGQIGVYKGLGLFRLSQDAATDSANTVVLDTFRAFVTVSIQGLILLNAAWLGSIHEDQVKSQVVATQAVLSAMVEFGNGLASLVDAQVASNLQTYGKRPLIDGILWDCGGGNVTSNNPFGADWIQWDPGEGQYPGKPAMQCPYLAQAPWSYNTHLHQITLDSQGRIWVGSDFESWNFPPPGPSRYDPAQASAMHSFLAPLSQMKS
jgi:hypothetical protein